MNPDEQNQPVPTQESSQPEQSDQWQQPDQQPQGYAPIVEQEPAGAPQQVADELAAEPVPTEAEVSQTEVLGEDQLVRWTASEHIHREKNPLWYVIFAVVVVLLMLIAFFLMRSWTFTVLIPVMAAALMLYVRRPPLVHEYTLSRKGLHINDKLYEFDSFREFGLVHDDDENSIILVPRKRFLPGVTVYFPTEVGEPVVDMLAARLPMREVRLDPIERLIRALHI